MRIRTESGSIYTLGNGRITREGSDCVDPIVNLCVTFHAAPVVGEGMRMRIYGFGTLTTSRVTEIS